MKAVDPQRSGFTLLEVLVASVILAVAILGMISAILYIHRLNQSARENELAVQGGQQMVEEVIACPLDQVETSYGGYTFDVSGLSPRSDDPDGKVGSIEVDGSDLALVQVTVQIEWTGIYGDRSLRFDTTMTKRE